MSEEKTTAIVKPDEQRNLTREQIDLIKHTVAHGATDTELQLFLYQARKRGLDPLTRQIHFIKRKQYNPDTEKYEDVGTIQTGIDGFRVIADRTGKLSGIRRGATYSANGDLVSAWAEVYRKDWTQPAKEEVRFSEYCQRTKAGDPTRLWKTMPETMLKKVAEAAALRMAFPEDLSGIYSHDEMMQADTEVIPVTIAKSAEKPKQQASVSTSTTESPVVAEAVKMGATLTPDQTMITAEQKQELDKYANLDVASIAKALGYKVKNRNELTADQAEKLITECKARTNKP